MADMLYMRLDGIDGEAPIGNSQKMIKLLEYSHGLSLDVAPLRPSVGKEATLRRSYCQHGLFQVTKALDKTSPKILAACSSGVVFKNVIIYVCSSKFDQLTKTSEPAPFWTIVMEDVLIADFQYQFRNDWQVESISFRYSAIGWHTEWIDPESGDRENLEPVGWDRRLNANEQVDVPSKLKWKSGSLI